MKATLEVTPTTVVDIIQYLNEHQEDIAEGVDDFHLLRSVFTDIIGGPPKGCNAESYVSLEDDPW